MVLGRPKKAARSQGKEGWVATQPEIPPQGQVANESGPCYLPVEAGPAHSSSPSVVELSGSSIDSGSSQYGVKRGPIQPQKDTIRPVILEEERFDDTPIKEFKILGRQLIEINHSENELLLATDEPFSYSQAARNTNCEDLL
ncbi:hypothetical protein E3N88_26071 [Mikania micrantha]|uniref:Uncharacterized protein n=1 Tax=Mikania micrantha TaxID=192012 RepID=A0A5N6N7I8_9ASTR|nr:hypothetical protein E3N88_26071 [Mikania micrantha]